jgi:hypothetical protein
VSIPSNIPFLDLVTPHVELEQELTAVFQQVLRTAASSVAPWSKISKKHLPPSVEHSMRSR